MQLGSCTTHTLYIYKLTSFQCTVLFYTATTNVTTLIVLSNHFYSLTSVILIHDIILVIVLNYFDCNLSTSMGSSVVV
jgi:hypothetical protein